MPRGNAVRRLVPSHPHVANPSIRSPVGTSTAVRRDRPPGTIPRSYCARVGSSVIRSVRVTTGWITFWSCAIRTRPRGCRCRRIRGPSVSGLFRVVVVVGRVLDDAMYYVGREICIIARGIPWDNMESSHAHRIATSRGPRSCVFPIVDSRLFFAGEMLWDFVPSPPHATGTPHSPAPASYHFHTPLERTSCRVWPTWM